MCNQAHQLGEVQYNCRRTSGNDLSLSDLCVCVCVCVHFWEKCLWAIWPLLLNIHQIKNQWAVWALNGLLRNKIFQSGTNIFMTRYWQKTPGKVSFDDLLTSFSWLVSISQSADFLSFSDNQNWAYLIGWSWEAFLQISQVSTNESETLIKMTHGWKMIEKLAIGWNHTEKGDRIQWDAS